MARSTTPRANIIPLTKSTKQPTGMWRNLLAAARLMSRRDRTGSTRYGRRANPFVPATPLPGVVGEGRKPEIPQIAMDAANVFQGAVDDISDVPSAGWAGAYANQYFASAYAEGQEWLGYAVLAILAQRPEYRVMTDTYATEMTREWIEIKSKSEDHDKQDRIDELVERLQDLRLRWVVKSAIEHDGFQGRGQIFIDTGDEGDELKTPIGAGGEDTRAKFGRDGLAHDFDPMAERERDRDKPRRQRIRRLSAIEPMWTYPSQYNANDPLKPDWYRPEIWWVMGREVHRTRLLTFVSNPVPDMLKPAYSFGGLSRTQMAKPYVDFYLRNRTSSSDLLNNFSNVVLATDLSVTTMEEGSDLFRRVETQNVLRDNQGMFVINKDSEELNIVAAPLGGVKDLVQQSQEHMTTPSQIPIVKFFGNQPSGLNADSEGVIRLFYDRVRGLQESLLREPVQTIVNLVMIELWGEVDNDIEFNFIELWQLDEAGKSAIQKTKADQRAGDIEAGIITPEEGRKSAARDPDSQYAGLDLHEPLPEPEEPDLFGEEPPGEGEAPVSGAAAERGEVKGVPGIKPSHRDIASKIASTAGSFGSPATGGFSGNDDAIDEISDEKV